MALSSAAAISLVLLSPALLREARGDREAWERLSFIGQTYGAMSALIAVLALVGVAATLVYQAREMRRAADESRRQAMSDLLRMAMDDPADPTARKHKQQQMYTNLTSSPSRRRRIPEPPNGGSGLWPRHGSPRGLPASAPTAPSGRTPVEV